MASITRFYALILSTVLLLSGVPGFFPDVPTFQALITFFALTLVHSVVHIAVGLLGLLITVLASDESVRIYTIGIALLYGALAVVGLLGVNFAPILYFNGADNWLHGSIFVLSLGVFLAGIAEERLLQRKAHVADGLSLTQWDMPPASARTSAAPPPQASWQAQAGMDILDAGQSPLYQQPSQPRYSQPEQLSWGMGSWGQQRQQPSSQPNYQQPPSQPYYQQPPSQPYDPARDPSRDPWTREQRHAPYQQPSRPASSPSRGQQSNPWSQNPSQPGPRPPSGWPQSQPPQGPPQGPSPWSPWPRDSQPRDERQPQQPRDPRDQWPLDEWPSVRDSQPLQ